MANEAVLVARGSGNWGDRKFPKKGWECMKVEDLGKPSMICGMCRSKTIRYVQYMRHPSGRELRVGCICAGNMEGNLAAAQDRDREMQKAAVRFRNRSKALERDQRMLSDYRPHNAVDILKEVRRRAFNRARGATADFERYRTMSHFMMEMNSTDFAKEAEVAVKEAVRMESLQIR